MTAAEGFIHGLPSFETAERGAQSARMVRENRVSGSCRAKSEVVIAATTGVTGSFILQLLGLGSCLTCCDPC